MTATEILRRLLDERGVEWKEHRHQMPGSMAVQVETLWGQPHDQNGKPLRHVYHNRATEMGDGRLFLEVQLATPQQAIDATLGPEHTYTREDVEGAFVSGYSLGTLPVGSDPQWDENRQTVDEHMAELGWVRADATLGRGECEVETTENWIPAERYHRCKSCGAFFAVMDASGDIAPRFCPICCRRVREVE